MKKALVIFLSLIMLMSVVSPAVTAVAAAGEATPIVYIRGNSEKLYNAEGKEVIADIGDMTIGGEGEEVKDKIIEATANIALPFLMEGLLNDKWDNYGKAIYDEVSPLFEQAMLDKNGDPQYGTGVPEEVIKESERIATTNRISNGQYGFYSYMFRFDWRLDPYEHVDRLHEYIKTVLKATGKNQVSLAARCLGGSILTAYLEKYGSEKLVKNVMYCEVLSDGCSAISKGFSGQLKFDSKSLQRYEGQLTCSAEIGFGVGISVTELAQEIIVNTIDLLTQVGVTDIITEDLEKIYNRLYKALVPALFHAIGYASQPIYWTFVEEEDFDKALDVMFGEEDSQTRADFAGLIEKIEYYREHVTSQRNELYKKFSEQYGIHMGVIAKYGFLNAPIVEGYNELSDTLVSLKDSSLGATCAEIGSTLSDEYISGRVADGFGEYISPDKQVDTSTCAFPETTWIVKNVHHDDFDRTGKALAEKFLNETGVTVENSGFARFRVNDYSTMTVSEMTEDNCGDLEFINRPVEKPTISTKLVSLFRFLTAFIKLISEWFTKHFA